MMLVVNVSINLHDCDVLMKLGNSELMEVPKIYEMIEMYRNSRNWEKREERRCKLHEEEKEF